MAPTLGRGLAGRWPLSHSIRGQPDIPATLGSEGGNLDRGELALGAASLDVLPGHGSGFPEGISKLPRGFLWDWHRRKAVQAPAKVRDRNPPPLRAQKALAAAAFAWLMASGMSSRGLTSMRMQCPSSVAANRSG